MKKILLSVLTACGVVSAQATVFQYSAVLNGANEIPVNTSPGTGSASVNYNNVTHSLQVQVTFSGLTNSGTGVTSAHIHAPTAIPFSGMAGVATTTPTFAGFPSSVFSGSYSNTLDLTSSNSWNTPYITANGGTTSGAESALASALTGGTSYLNLHSGAFPGGEIRGFLVPVPEPSSLALMGLSAVGLATGIWRRNRRGENS